MEEIFFNKEGREKLILGINKLNQALNEAIKNPELIQKVTAGGGELVGGTPQDLTNQMNKEIPRWTTIIDRLNIQPN